MKKYVLYIILIIALLLISGCEKNYEESLTKLNYNSEEESTTQIKPTEKLIKEIYYGEDGSINSWIDYFYDNDGNCIQDNIYIYGEIDSRREYEYDGGKKIKKTVYDCYEKESGVLYWYSEFEYDETGNCIKETEYNSNGEATSVCRFEYDKKGNCIITSWDDSTITKTDFDEYGKPIKEIVSDDYGERLYEYDNTYNNGLLTKCVVTIDHDYTNTYEYEYDKYGNVVKENRIFYGSKEKIEYIYDEMEIADTSTKNNPEINIKNNEKNTSDSINKSDLKLVKILHYNSSGYTDNWEEYEYDTYGNEVRHLFYFDSELDSFYQSNYDENGNLIMWSHYYNNIGLFQYYTCEYNSEGLCTNKTSYLSNGEVQDIELYVYDNNGNKIQTDCYRAGNRYSCSKFEYDSNNILVKIIFYDISYDVEMLSKWREYEYDIYGNMVKNTLFGSSGNIQEYELYEYDSTNNMISKKTYGSYGNLLHDFSYEYDSSNNLILEIENYSTGGYLGKEYVYD